MNHRSEGQKLGMGQFLVGLFVGFFGAEVSWSQDSTLSRTSPAPTSDFRLSQSQQDSIQAAQDQWLKDQIALAGPITLDPVDPEMLVPWPRSAMMHRGPSGMQFLPDSVLPEQVSPWRIAGLSVGATAVVGTGYVLFLQNWWGSQDRTLGESFEDWWNGGPAPVSFGTAEDNFTNPNTDKLTHALAGYYLAQGMYDGLRWTGLSKNASYFYAGTFNMGLQVLKDGRDGLAGNFSFLDIAAGTAGGYLPWIQYHVGVLRPLRLRFSYYRYDNSQYMSASKDSNALPYNFLRDLRNHDYWASYLVNDILPQNLEKYWPDPLALAVGVGGWYKGESFLGFGQRRYSLGLDWDIENAWGSRYAPVRRTLFFAGLLKIPNATVVLYPEPEFQIFYPFRF
jgi:hypothetical protein